MFEKVTNFLTEVRTEMKKVSWPSKEDVIKHTALVIIVSIIIAIFLGGFDFLFQLLMNRIVLYF